MPFRPRLHAPTRRAAVALAALLTLPSVAGAQAPPPRSSAKDTAALSGPERDQRIRELMREGISEYRGNRLEQARDAFEQAWRLSRHLDIAASLADVEMKLGRYREAAEYWEYYIANMPPDRTDAEAQLAECRKHLASVTVQVDLPDATLFVDGRITGRAPLDAPLWLEPGVHTLYARQAGKVSSSERVSLRAGEAKRVALSFPRPALANPSPAVALKASRTAVGAYDPRPSQSQTPLYILIGGGVLTAGALGSGIAFTLQAEDADEKLSLLLGRLRAEDPAGDSPGACSGEAPALPDVCKALAYQARERDRNRNIATASFAAAAVLGAATLTSYLLWPRKAAGDRARMQILPTWAGRARGVRLELNF